jgi:hypothetical protein
MIFTKSQWLPAERRAALVCAVLLLGLTACDRVSYVETLTIENPTDYDLLVNVRGNETSGVLGLGVVHKRATEEREQVIADRCGSTSSDIRGLMPARYGFRDGTSRTKTGGL